MHKLEQKAIENYFLVTDLTENLKKMMWAVSGRWPDSSERNVKEEWGRLGFQVRGEWEGTGWDPGLFVGVLLNGWDHCTKPVDRNLGPDACVILSLSEDLQPASEVSAYRQLVKHLKSVEFPNGWKFYDHAEDDNVISERYGAHRGPNPWHPFHIRRPLVKVLEGAQNAEEQICRFYKDAHEIVRLILEHPTLKEPWTKA